MAVIFSVCGTAICYAGFAPYQNTHTHRLLSLVIWCSSEYRLQQNTISIIQWQSHTTR